MLWIELKSKVIQLLIERDLSKPSIRLNALERLEGIIKSYFPDIYNNPIKLLNIDKNKFKEMVSRYKKLNSAEISVINNFYQILSAFSDSSNNKFQESKTFSTLPKKSKKICLKNKPKIVLSEEDLETSVFGLKPIANEKTEILILGTFPAKESIDANFYYQNQIKRFWGQALSYIGSFEYISNEERERILLDKKIGLWDIFECVERGSSNQDKAIKKAKYNDLSEFLDNHPSIKYLIFNGSNAYKWLKDDKPEIFERKGLETKKLQSSSGGNRWFNQGKDWEEYFKTINL